MIDIRLQIFTVAIQRSPIELSHHGPGITYTHFIAHIEKKRQMKRIHLIKIKIKESQVDFVRASQSQFGFATVARSRVGFVTVTESQGGCMSWLVIVAGQIVIAVPLITVICIPSQSRVICP